MSSEGPGPLPPPPQYSVAARQLHPLSGVREVVVAAEWDSLASDRSSPVDLDLSCVCFNECGQYVDSIYFSNLANENGSILHTGDSRDGVASGFDEEIIVHLEKLPKQVFALFFTITSFNGQSLDALTNAKLHLFNQSNQTSILTFPLAVTAVHGSSALIACKLYRDFDLNGSGGVGWSFHAIGASASATHFGHLFPTLQEYLRDVIPTVRISPPPSSIVMFKGETVSLSKDDSKIPLDHVTIGLGWDLIGRQAVDLDVSAVLFNRSHAQVEAVYFNRLQNSNGSIVHSGDNRTGEGEGDDEQISVSLCSIPSDITDIFVIVNSYTGHNFAMLKNAYVRVVEGGKGHHGNRNASVCSRSKSNDINGREMIRFQLNGAGNPNHTAMLMARLYVDRSSLPSGKSGNASRNRVWRLKAIGHGCVGRTYTMNTGEMTRELAGRLQSAGAFQYIPERNLNQNQHAGGGGGCIIQ